MTYSIGVDESSLSVEFSLVEVALVDDSIGEGELALALLPAIDSGTIITCFRPL